jgi:hypothetical protein
MNYQNPHATLIEKLYSMGVQEHSKYSFREILNRQDPDLNSTKHLLAFHKGLTERLNQKKLPWIARTNDRGLSYMCSEYKAFIFLAINQSFISNIYFTGNKTIDLLRKGNWLKANDNLGSERFRIIDECTLKLGIKFALESHKIAAEWEVLL